METGADTINTVTTGEVAEWPVLVYDEWKDTCETLHMYMQMAGKVKLALCPFVNQWWEVALHVSAHGVTTGPIPWRDRTFDLEFDLLLDQLLIRVSDGQTRELSLEPRTVADFYHLFMRALGSLDIHPSITTMPSEVPNAIPFDQDATHGAYDGEYARRWWHVLLAAERAMNRFRTPFHGKSSPVHLFWGGFDLNHTRFNGERANPDPQADTMMRFAENEANFSVGFWPGNEQAPAAFYAYMTPAPPGVESAHVQPEGAEFVPVMGEFFLPYDVAREAPHPEEAVLTFFQSTYEVCADLAGWDRASLEGSVPTIRQAR